MQPFFISTIIAVSVIACVLLLRLRFVIIYDYDLILRAKILFFRISLYPAKEKRVKISDFSYKKTERRRKKKLKKQARILKRKQKKEAPIKDVKKKEKPPSPEIIPLLKTILSLLKITLSRFFKHLRVDISRLILNISTDDPAKTAITYGVAAQLVAYILELLDRITNIKKGRTTEISVNADFISGKTSYDIHFEFSIQVWQLLDIGIRLAYNYLKSMPKLYGSSKSSK